MITDALLRLSTAQAVTATANSTDVIDLSQNRDIAIGNPLYAVIGVDVAAAAAGAATVTFQVVVSAAAALTSPTVIAATAPVPKAELTAGRPPIIIALNRNIVLAQSTGLRYLGIIYTVATGPLTAGAFTAYINDDDAGFAPTYPSGIAVA